MQVRETILPDGPEGAEGGGRQSAGAEPEQPGREPAGAAIMREFIPASPFARHVGVEIDRLETDRARLRLPFVETLATMGDLVHGGAVTTLLDTAAMAAAWCTDDVPDSLRGTTVGLNINFVAAGRGDLVADARVLRRGGSLCFCEVEVSDREERLVAKGLVTYKLG
jgi:uncharacterized protein (TIGR00369 family)